MDREQFENRPGRFRTLRGMDTKDLKPLISALENGYRYRNHEMLGFFLSATMSLWGLPEWQSVPEDVQPKIAEAIDAYADIVAAQPPFMDVLGPLYMELGSRGARAQLGQYFTPWPIADFALNARWIVNDGNDQRRPPNAGKQRTDTCLRPGVGVRGHDAGVCQ